MGAIRFLRADSHIDFSAYSLAFGVFDGIHRGHQRLIGEAIRDAQMCGGLSGVLTFSVDPDELFDPDGLVKLMTNSERIFSLAQTGVDAVFVLPFDYEFAAMSPAEFLEWTFGCSAPASMHVGGGFRFGHFGSGTVQDLSNWGMLHGTRVDEVDLLQIGGQRVSSTRIRKLLLDGKELEALALLGTLPKAGSLQIAS